MICPICKKRSRVVDSRLIEGGVNRKRQCARHTFLTIERPTTEWLYKDARKGRKKLPPKPKPALKPKPAPNKANWLDMVKTEAGKLLRTMAL